MNGAFARQLRLNLAATIATELIVVGLLIVIIGYAIEVATISQRTSYTAREIPEILVAYGAPHEAMGVAKTIMSHLYHPGLQIVTTNNTGTYEGHWTALGPHGTTRFLIKSDPNANVPFRRRTAAFGDYVAFYIARLAGYAGAVTNFRGTQIVVEAEDPLLQSLAMRLLLMVAGVVVVAIIIANVAARRLTDRALQPLNMVLNALESFAEGDLTPRLVTTQRNDELGRLVTAYNGAIETVNSALAERARTEQQMRNFIADAGHQLQTPLTVVRGFIGILRRGEVHSQGDVPRILDTMDRQSGLMAALIKKLMLLQNWENPNIKPCEVVEIGGLVEDIVTPIAAAHPHRDIAISLNRRANVKVVPDELTYAVSNLVDNAIKYAPEGRIDIGVSGENGTVRVTVADHGVGMSCDEIDRVFDRFYRGTRRDVPGSGLGLAIAKRAVERAHGTLSVTSTPGIGSCFTITLPIAYPATN